MLTVAYANVVPVLVNVLQNADFRTKKEAGALLICRVFADSTAWALSNATSGGLAEPQQIRYLVSQGCIKPLCDLLKTPDNKCAERARKPLTRAQSPAGRARWPRKHPQGRRAR